MIRRFTMPKRASTMTPMVKPPDQNEEGADVLTIGNQLRAARSLIGIDQSELAERAVLNVSTIRSMEASGSAPIAGRAANVHVVQRVLEVAGVEFVDDGRPGVRMRCIGGHPKPAGPATDAFEAMDNAVEKDRSKR